MSNQQRRNQDGGHQGASEETALDEVPAAVELQTLTAEQLQDLKERAAKSNDVWERLVRQTADFENFKKRAGRERQDAIRYANEGLLLTLIPVLDNFEMALAAAAAAGESAAQSLQTGVSMIYNQLRSALLDAGLEEVAAEGQPFDPNLHEAVSQEESADAPEGTVLRQLRKGYKLRDRLIRPSTVVVAKKPSHAS